MANKIKSEKGHLEHGSAQRTVKEGEHLGRRTPASELGLKRFVSLRRRPRRKRRVVDDEAPEAVWAAAEHFGG